MCIHFLSLPAPYLFIMTYWFQVQPETEWKPPLHRRRGHFSWVSSPCAHSQCTICLLADWSLDHVTKWDWGRGAGRGTREEMEPFSFQRWMEFQVWVRSCLSKSVQILPKVKHITSNNLDNSGYTFLTAELSSSYLSALAAAARTMILSWITQQLVKERLAKQPEDLREFPF